jgi:transposase
MGYHKTFPKGTAKVLEGFLKTTKDVDVLRRVQAIYFRAKHGYGADQIAKMTGYSVGTVRNLHAAFLRDGTKIFNLGIAGGRKAAYKTPQEEEDFLRPFMKDGDAGGILEVSRVHEAHCAVLGKRVPVSTTYRLLHRHGWRKVAPRPQHPKTDQDAQAAFKKMA